MECFASTKSLNGTDINVAIEAYGLLDDGTEFANGLSSTFKISFWSEPDAILSTGPTIKADYTEVTIDNQVPKVIDVIITATATDYLIGSMEVDLGGAVNLVSVETGST